MPKKGDSIAASNDPNKSGTCEKLRSKKYYMGIIKIDR